MRFKDIKINADGVELDRVEIHNDGTELTQKMKNATAPLAEFRTALQAFTGYALALIGAPKEWHDDTNVSSIHLSEEPKTKRRGLIVTITRKIERAKNRVMVINTPLMHQPTEDADGTNPGTFERTVLTMITDTEREATRYWNGERDQTDMFEGQGGGAKPRGGKGGKGKPEGDDEVLRQLLLAAGRDVPIDAIARATSSERQAASAWAETATDPSTREADRKPEPEWVQKNATPALIDEVSKAREKKRK